MRFAAICFISLLLISCSAINHNTRVALPAASSEIASCIRNAKCHRVFPVAHRGNGLGAPENSCEAVRRSVEAEIPIVEIDLRLSRDGIPYVLHDNDLHRTTNGAGPINEKTSDELSRIFLENSEPLPKFYDIYAISRGRAVLDLHIKETGVIRPTAEWIAIHGSFDDIIFFVNGDDQMKEAAKMKRLYQKMIIMARLRSWNDVRDIRRVFGMMPEVVHVTFPTPGVFQIACLHRLKTKVFGNAWASLPILQEINFLMLLPFHPDFIQSNNPATLQRMLGK